MGQGVWYYKIRGKILNLPLKKFKFCVKRLLSGQWWLCKWQECLRLGLIKPLADPRQNLKAPFIYVASKEILNNVN